MKSSYDYLQDICSMERGICPITAP